MLLNRFLLLSVKTTTKRNLGQGETLEKYKKKIVVVVHALGNAEFGNFTMMVCSRSQSGNIQRIISRAQPLKPFV